MSILQVLSKPISTDSDHPMHHKDVRASEGMKTLVSASKSIRILQDLEPKITQVDSEANNVVSPVPNNDVDWGSDTVGSGSNDDYDSSGSDSDLESNIGLRVPTAVPASDGKPCHQDPNVCLPDCTCSEVYNDDEGNTPEGFAHPQFLLLCIANV